MLRCAAQVLIVSDAGILEIPIVAARRPPELNIPADGVFDLGGCLLGQAFTKQIKLENTGGPVRLRLLRLENYPQMTAAQQNVQYLSLDPFIVAPTQIDLCGDADTGSSSAQQQSNRGTLRVGFAPLQVGDFSAQVVLLSDAGSARVLTFIGVCTVPEISVTFDDSSSCELEHSVTASKVHMPAVCAGGRVARTFTVLNSSVVSAVLEWRWQTQDGETEAETEGVFACVPQRCVMAPGEPQLVTITCTPQASGLHVSQLQGTLLNMPPPAFADLQCPGLDSIPLRCVLLSVAAALSGGALAQRLHCRVTEILQSSRSLSNTVHDELTEGLAKLRDSDAKDVEAGHPQGASLVPCLVSLLTRLGLGLLAPAANNRMTRCTSRRSRTAPMRSACTSRESCA